MASSIRVLFELSIAVEPPLPSDGLATVRRMFVEQMDLAASEITRRGMDLDECEVDRLAWCHNSGGQGDVEFPVAGLADLSTLLASGPLGSSLAQITRLGVRVWVDPRMDSHGPPASELNASPG